jgi:hypothetical protein
MLVASALGGCTEVCSFEDQVGTFFVEHEDAIDCKFAHWIAVYGDTELVGAQTVHDCIIDAIAESRSFVGGYVVYGIDAGDNFAYLGSANAGAMTLSYVSQPTSVYSPDTILRTRCSEIVARSIGRDDIGLECVGANLAAVCTP